MIFDPHKIESFDVTANTVKIEGIQYTRQFHIKTKAGSDLKPVSLADLKNKYGKSGSRPVLFMVDGELIASDYDEYSIDENYILRISIDNFKNTKEDIDMRIIKVLTKSKENLKKSKEIRIRGSATVMNRYPGHPGSNSD